MAIQESQLKNIPSGQSDEQVKQKLIAAYPGLVLKTFNRRSDDAYFSYDSRGLRRLPLPVVFLEWDMGDL